MINKIFINNTMRKFSNNYYFFNARMKSNKIKQTTKQIIERL